MHYRKDEKKQWVKKGIDFCIQLLYPRRCPFCTDILMGNNELACARCKEKLPYIKEPRCMKCGKHVYSEEVEYCMDCTKKEHEYKRGIALWSYDKAVRLSIYRFKYKNKREYAAFYVDELIERYGELIRAWNAEALIPVPLHKSRMRKRGYNQTEVLAKRLGKRMYIPVVTDILIRSKKTLPQKTLNYKERQKNLKNAFKIVKNGVELKRVIVIDDIYTTGSTVNAIAKLLRCAGVEEIYVIVLCVGKGY